MSDQNDDELPDGPSRLGDEEMDELAWEIADGEVFISNDPDVINDSFGGILGLFAAQYDPDDVVTFFESVGAVYQPMSKAMPRSVNGRPMFMSASFVHHDDVEPLREQVEEYEGELERLDPTKNGPEMPE